MSRVIESDLSFPDGECDDCGRGEDGDGDDVGEAANVVAVGEGEEELAPTRSGHVISVATEPLEKEWGKGLENDGFRLRKNVVI